MRTLLLCAIAIVACGKSDDGDKSGAKPATPGAPSPTTPATPAKPTPMAPAAEGSSLSCTKLLPKALVDKYLGGFTFEDKAKVTPRPDQATCNYKRADPIGVIGVTFLCKEAVYGAMDATIKMMKETKMTKKSEAKEVPGVGKGAISIMDGNVTFWATNVHCMVTLTAFGDSAVAKDVAAFAKELDAALSPASL
jgi:hypothetical protein